MLTHIADCSFAKESERALLPLCIHYHWLNAACELVKVGS